MLTGLLLFGVFLAMAMAMYAGKLPALLALPILAFAVTVVSAFPSLYSQNASAELWPRLIHAASESLNLAFTVVAAQGVGRLQAAIFTVMLGGIFGHFLKGSGAAESLVRKVAELAGDRPFSLSLAMTVAVSALFTTLSGLGSVILVANIYFPALLSLGVPPLLTGCLFIMGFSLGGIFNLANWALYLDVLHLSSSQVLSYAVPFGVLNLAVLTAFLIVEFRKSKIPVPARSAVLAALGTILLGALLLAAKSRAAELQGLLPSLRLAFLLLLAALFAVPRSAKGLGGAAVLAPFVPIGLVLFLGWPISSALLLGILYLYRRAQHPNRGKLLVQSALEGIQGVAPAVAVMMGIGMVLVAVSQPAVGQSLGPWLAMILPRTSSGYVLLFTALAPLALYRGPLNLWGMGSGLVGLIQKSNLIAAPRIMAAFLSTGQIQGVCDPTNTHNVWVANQLKVELNAILKKTLPYMWLAAFLGLILGLYAG
ncbi:MAG: hypothetical protein HY921_10670 [Elusimicrobia bacterium]|nr:hypothetical protein [Elusimicrobiota bacterium]